MSKKWSTKAKDLQIAAQIIEQYAHENNTSSLGLFELFVNTEEKRMNFRLSQWVMALAEYYKETYGKAQGNFVIRKVISNCLVDGQTMH